MASTLEMCVARTCEALTGNDLTPDVVAKIVDALHANLLAQASECRIVLREPINAKLCEDAASFVLLAKTEYDRSLSDHY